MWNLASELQKKASTTITSMRETIQILKNKLLNKLFPKKITNVKAQQKREKARIYALKKLPLICRKKDKKQLVTAISTLLKQFFKNYFGIRYSFTAEELKYELSRRRIDPYLKKKTRRIFELVCWRLYW